jgi:Integrase core domain
MSVKLAPEAARQCAAYPSERQRCRLPELLWTRHRYCPRRPSHEARRTGLRMLATERPRWRILPAHRAALAGVPSCESQGFYREEVFAVRRRRKKRTAVAWTPLAAPTLPYERRSLDFVSEILADGGKVHDERLTPHWFVTLAGARFHIYCYCVYYHEVRPHSTFGSQTPARLRKRAT